MGSRSDACRAELRALPAVLAGRLPDPHGYRERVLIHVGNALLVQIRFSFLLKRGGGTGTDGVKWPPKQAAKRGAKILFDSGDLLNSLSPGKDWYRPSGNKGQVFRFEGPRVAVGSTEKPWHHKGVPGRLPARPLWPLSGVAPEGWMRACRAAAWLGVRECVMDVVIRHGRVS